MAFVASRATSSCGMIFAQTSGSDGRLYTGKAWALCQESPFQSAIANRASQ